MAHLPKRAWTDLQRLERLNLNSDSTPKFILDSSPFSNEEETPTTYLFIGRILPMSEPLNQTALKIEIKLTNEYPAKPPSVRLLTQIHHPNIREDGGICLPILNHDDLWKASIFLDTVIQELINIIDHPNLNIPVNDTVANEYLYHKDVYDRKVLEIIEKNKLPRI